MCRRHNVHLNALMYNFDHQESAVSVLKKKGKNSFVQLRLCQNIIKEDAYVAVLSVRGI